LSRRQAYSTGVSLEVLISLPEHLAPVTSVRSTLIQSSLESLRKHGHFDRYLTLVDPRFRERIVETIAPEWLEMELAVAHYTACDALFLQHDELIEIGEAVGDHIQGTFVSMIVRRARVLGLTPWVPLGQVQRLWDRLMRGGGVSLVRTGPNEARIEVCLLPLAQFTYFRTGFCGVISSGVKLGAGRNVTIRVLPSVQHEQRCVFRCSWV
jgi:hypothetical protein